MIKKNHHYKITEKIYDAITVESAPRMINIEIDDVVEILDSIFMPPVITDDFDAYPNQIVTCKSKEQGITFKTFGYSLRLKSEEILYKKGDV